MEKYLHNKHNENDSSNNSLVSLDKKLFSEFFTEKPISDIDENEKYAKDWKSEVFALIGFCISSIIFIMSGIQNGDILTIIGSSIQLVSCIVWMIPYRKYL